MSQYETRIPSPCVGVCSLDERDVCVGCGRTPEEIGEWGTMDNHQRLEVRRLAAQRVTEATVR